MAAEAPPPDPGDDPVVARVLAAPKYRHVDPALVARLVAEARPRERSEADTAKAVKRRLHQIFGAFRVGPSGAALSRAAEALARDPSDRSALVAAMRAHASTAERVPHLDEVADLLEGWCGRPASVVDLACGFDPLATPWLALAEGCTWWCCDVDRDLVAGLDALGPHLPVALTAETVDLVAQVVTRPADLGLALKAVTTLDQQRPGRAAEVLGALRCADVVISLPSRSLGGGRRYADPLGVAEAVAEEAGLEVVHDAPVGVEHYVHLRPVRPARRPGSPRGGAAG